MSDLRTSGPGGWRRGAAAFAIAVVVGLVLVACGKTKHEPDAKAPPAGAAAGDEAEARIYAAASLTDVIGVLAKRFEPLHGGHVTPSFGASNTLAQQIHEGAPPGVFISASPEWVDHLEEWGLAEPGTRVNLLANALVVVVPKGAKLRPAKLADLASPKYAHLALADPEHVPAGRYAKSALDAAGVYEALKGRIVAAQDVRMALAYVERDEAEAGIVYATDANVSAKVDTALRVPPELHAKIVYPMVLVKGANRRAHALYDFLKSDLAWHDFAKAGFTKPAK